MNEAQGTLDLFNTTEAQTNKEAAIELVLEHNEDWAQTAIVFLECWLGGKPDGFRFTAEDFRVAALSAGIVPRHHNAWGGLFAKRIPETGLVLNTGTLANMQAPQSHARKTFIYQKRG